MAATSIAGGVFIPTRTDESAVVINVSTFVCDATGEAAVLVFRVPKTGDLTRFEGYTGAVANVPDNGQRFSFQGVDLATGLNDGGVDQFATVASGSVAVGWTNPGDFDSPRAVTKGKIACCVVDNPSFTAGDSFTMGCTILSSDLNFPYGISATSTKQTNLIPLYAVRYDDGTYAYISPEMWATDLISSTDFETDTTPDEIGQKVHFPFPYTFDLAAWVGRINTTGNAVEVVVYNAANTVIAGPVSVDADVVPLVSQVRLNQHYLDTVVTVAVIPSSVWSSRRPVRRSRPGCITAASRRPRSGRPSKAGCTCV